MPQMNIHLTDDFLRMLERLVEIERLPSKSAAVRKAVSDAVERAMHRAVPGDFSSWRGLAGSGIRQGRRFRTDEDLWR